MSVAGLSGKIHKWLALAMAVQILFWFISGLFFAIAPIERVRSEHMVAEQPRIAVPLDEAARGLARIDGGAERIEVRTLLGRPVALLHVQGERPRLHDLESGALLSPVAPELAARIAAADYAGAGRPAGVEAVAENSTEYRGPLPAWRVRFDDGADRALYVAADTGAVAARRSTLWRWFDFLWGLHIMDWSGRENFNNPWLVIFTALSLVVIVTGIILFPSRLGWTARRRRAARRQATAQPFSASDVAAGEN